MLYYACYIILTPMLSWGKIERISHIWCTYHTYTDIHGIDYQILVEADFLVNAFKDNMPDASIESFMTKVFMTETGTEFLKTMYKSQ